MFMSEIAEFRILVYLYHLLYLHYMIIVRFQNVKHMTDSDKEAHGL